MRRRRWRTKPPRRWTRCSSRRISLPRPIRTRRRRCSRRPRPVSSRTSPRRCRQRRSPAAKPAGQRQQSQAQVEVGLQTMIHQLEEAQQRKLEALARQLADMQEQIANLLRQQSGLNYDNLALQGDPVLKTADAKLIDHLLELAERTKDHLPPTPDVDTQTRLQEQTERNTRGVSKSAEALPDGSAIVADLNRAADRMGRRDHGARAKTRGLISSIWRPRMNRRRSKRWPRWSRRRN